VIAIGYVRRSKESTERTVSLETQRDRIASYCADQGWRLVEVLAHDGVSGGRRERLERLAERVRATGARVIVIYHLGRLARDLAGTLDYLRRFSRRGVELHVVGRGRIEADTASGFIVTAVEGLAAEHYRRVISEKTRDALARLRAKGRRVSRWAPYGYRFGPEGRLVPEPREQAALGQIAALKGSGLSLRAVSRALAAVGVMARNGRPCQRKRCVVKDAGSKTRRMQMGWRARAWVRSQSADAEAETVYVGGARPDTVAGKAIRQALAKLPGADPRNRNSNPAPK
jgi:DNA invertase Pin-like site-specific DNA recombinase